MLWSDDGELFKLMRNELFTAVVGDVMDQMGLTHQFLPPEIRPLRDDMIALGRAMPVLEADFFPPEEGVEPHSPLARQAFGMMFAALDDLKANEVYVATGGSPRYALWGELMSTRAMHLGATGAVLNGHSRDTRGVLRLNFPTFSYGPYAQDQGARGKVVDFRVPIEIAGIRIAPGDIVFGDIDGVTVIPRAVEEDALHRAIEKVRAENLVKTALEKGMSASEAWATYKVM